MRLERVLKARSPLTPLDVGKQMITKKDLQKRWRRTVFHLIGVNVVIIFVIASLVVKQFETGEGPSHGTLSLIFLGFLVYSAIFYFAARKIRNVIGRKFGKD